MEIQGLKQDIMEDYKSEYEAALARAKAVCLTDDDKKGAMEAVFPELMELDKDDEIRQALIKYFTLWSKSTPSTMGFSNEDIVDWLKRVKSVRVKSAKVTTGKLAEMIEQKALEDFKRINPWTLTVGLSHQEVTKKSKQGNMSKMCPRCVQEQKPQGFSIIEIINQGNAKVAADMVESKYKELTHSQVTKKSEQEPTNWTEEDEKMFTSYSNNVLELWKKEYAEEFINWIKSLKQRLS